MHKTVFICYLHKTVFICYLHKTVFICYQQMTKVTSSKERVKSVFHVSKHVSLQMLFPSKTFSANSASVREELNHFLTCWSMSFQLTNVHMGLGQELNQFFMCRNMCPFKCCFLRKLFPQTPHW